MSDANDKRGKGEGEGEGKGKGEGEGEGLGQLDELEWRSPEWINFHGLRTDNVLEYFSQSPFWDRQCNNQQLKMQRQFQGDHAAGTVLSIPTFDGELRKLRGVEYVVHLIKEPDLWVIRRERRYGDGAAAYSSDGAGAKLGISLETYLQGGPGLGVVDDVVVEADYYCIGSKVYMAGKAGDVLLQGCLSVAENLGAGLTAMAALGAAAAAADDGDAGDAGDAGDDAGGSTPLEGLPRHLLLRAARDAQAEAEKR